MSLLMEALKKAELAKRKSAEMPMSTDPASPPVAAPPSGEGLKLELTPAEPRESKQEPAYVTAPSASESPVAATPAPKFTSMIDRLATETPVQAAKPVERPAPLPEPKQEPKPVLAAPAPVAAPLAASVPPPVPSPIRAEPAVAVPPRAPRRQFISRQWIAAGVGAFLLLVGGGYAYYQSMSDYMRQQAAMAMPQTDPVSEVVPEPEPPPPPVVTKKPAAKVAVAKPAPEKSAGAPAPTPVSRAPVVDLASDAPAPSPGVDVPVDSPTPLGVARDVDKNDVFALLQHAYTAYQSGDDARAQAGYARVLAYDERNRDALLGLAAIAVRGRDTARAMEIYSELLNLDPKDSMAQAGLAGLTGSLDPLGQEARIKNLLDQEPNAPHLLFAYASVLMQQQRWSEAARALQSAQQARNDHPDYAYNLAVSLDHLGQVGGALRFYRRAVELAARHPGVFKIEDAQRRIAALRSTSEGVPQ